MPELIEQVLHLGADRYGRRVTATRYKDAGQWYWKLETQPSSQRDDGERMFDLTDNNLRELAAALDAARNA